MRLSPLGPSLKATVMLALLFAVVLPLTIRGRYPSLDLWWHLRTGQYILQTRTVPRLDMFSFTVQGRPWMDHEWAVQPFLYGVYHRCGLGGLFRACALAIALIATVLAALLYRLTGQVLLSLVGTLLILVGMDRYLVLRPQVLSYLFFAGLLLLLLRARQDRTTTRALWFTPCLMVVWANCHGAFMMGFALVGLYWLGAEWEAHRSGGEPYVGYRDTLRAVLPVSLLACLANPYGARLFLVPFEHLTCPILRSAISEWAPPDPTYPRHALAIGGGLLVLIPALLSRSERRLPADVWLALLVTAMALTSRRHIPFFLMGIIPAAAGPLGRLLRNSLGTPGQTKRSRRDSRKNGRSRRVVPGTWDRICHLGERRSRLWWLAPAAVLVCAFACTPTTNTTTYMTDIPVSAADFLSAREIPGNVFNPLNWGGYLIYRLWPRSRVFIDGRFPAVIDERTFLDYRSLSAGAPGWERLVEEYDLRLLVCSSFQRGLVRQVLNTPQWTLIYHDRQAAIFQRVDGPGFADQGHSALVGDAEGASGLQPTGRPPHSRILP